MDSFCISFLRKIKTGPLQNRVKEKHFIVDREVSTARGMWKKTDRMGPREEEEEKRDSKVTKREAENQESICQNSRFI